MQELGLVDDISDVSDPEFSEDAASTPRKKDGTESDWDSTSELPLTPKSPLATQVSFLLF
jgi:hypothetical protein